MAESEYKWRLRKYDEGRRERAREAQGLRDAAAANVPSGWGADSVEANTPSAPSRSFGFRSGAARVNEGLEKNLAAAGSELGAPTSYAGGAGAPTPIGVIRGMKQTYAADTGGPQLSEFATPTQAKQGYNREQLGMNLAAIGKLPPEAQAGAREAVAEKFGGYIHPKGPEIRAEGEQARLNIASEIEKRPDLVALAEERKAATAKTVGDENVSTLKNYLVNTFGTFDPASGRVGFKPSDENMARDATAAEEVARRDGGKAAISHFQERQNVRALLGEMKGKGRLPEGIDVNAYLSAMSQNPEAWQELVTRGKALRTTSRPETPTAETLGGQLDILGRASTPNWMRPKEWGPAQ